MEWPEFKTQTLLLLAGHVLKALAIIPTNIVDCIVTSPPYWGLRDYGEETVTIWDGEDGCEHEWGELERGHHIGQVPQTKNQIASGSEDSGAFCTKCGAWRGQLGLEPSLDLYLNHLLQVTAELKRVLKPTGVMFWNQGDSYGGSGTGQEDMKESWAFKDPRSKPKYTSKCMCLQNYRLLIKLVDEQGWIARNVNIWNKPNHMPSSVRDRFTNGYEPIFMLVKSNNTAYYWNEKTGLMADRPPTERVEGIDWGWREVGGDYSECHTKIDSDECEQFGSPQARKYRQKKLVKYSFWNSFDYWFDLDAVREHSWQRKGHSGYFDGEGNMLVNPAGKNPGNIWTIPTQPFPEAHFAVFPEKLPERCIKCGCPKEICTQCGKARVRITEQHNEFRTLNRGRVGFGIDEIKAEERKGASSAGYVESRTIGWTTCSCQNAEYRPGIVLDSFLGSGTTMKVARRMGMSCIGIEISPKYMKMAKREVGWNEGLLGIDFREIKAEKSRK